MAKILNSNTFYKTFSGSDALAFLILPEIKPILLGSLTTVSYSMYRDKKPVPLMGKVNVSGYTRGMRVIAGTLVFTLINQHFTKDLLTQVPYLAQHGKMKADELPMFDIMIVCANEYGYANRAMIYGIDITDDAQILSIEDIFTENTFNFVARDIDEFTAINNTIVSSSSRTGEDQTIQTVSAFDYSMDKYIESVKYLKNSYSNNDMINVQLKLKEKGLINKITGVLDNETNDAIVSFQYSNGLNPTGILDITTYNLITNELDKEDVVVNIRNKNGAFVFDSTNHDKVIGISKYKDSYTGKIIDKHIKVSFYGNVGYIDLDDTDYYKEDNCEYNEHIPSGTVYEVNYNDFDPSMYGQYTTVTDDKEVKISAVSIYNDNTKVYSKILKLNKNETKDINLSMIPESYIFDIELNENPKKIEFIIYISSEEPKKWTIEFI